MWYFFTISGCFALVINDPIPNLSQYKWLDISATATGDKDPATGYIYEPRRFIDRICDFPENDDSKGTQIMVITQVWGDYGFNIECKNSINGYIF